MSSKYSNEAKELIHTIEEQFTNGNGRIEWGRAFETNPDWKTRLLTEFVTKDKLQAYASCLRMKALRKARKLKPKKQPKASPPKEVVEIPMVNFCPCCGTNLRTFCTALSVALKH